MLNFTANYSLEVVKSLPSGLEPGVYYGWAKVNDSPVYEMVANIGWCPFYQNKQMSVVSFRLMVFHVLNYFLLFDSNKLYFTK